jgi:hypothetical protein
VASSMLVAAAWQTDPGQVHPLDVSTAEGIGLDARLARLYTPVRAQRPVARWPMGRYVLELARLAAEGAPLGSDGSSPRWYIAITVPGPST